MAGRKRKRPERRIALPWEESSSLLGRMLAGARWRAILALVVFGIGVASVYDYADARDRQTATYAAIEQVRTALLAFRSEVGRCPRSTVELIHPPRSRTRFLRDMPRDGWGRELQIHCPGVDDPDGVDVLSAGPSGDFLNDDNLR